MNGKASILLSGLVAILMVTCAVPFMASEDSDALTGNTAGMSLNVNSAVLYKTGGTSSIQLSIDQYITGDNPSNAAWTLNDLDDGTTFVQLSTNTGSSTTVSVNSNATITDAMSVEVVATIGTHHASAVIVVYPNPTTTATTFHYFIQIESSAYNYALSQEDEDFVVTIPNGYSIGNFNNGVWITVTQNETGLSDANFNAGTAFDWYLNENGWDGELGSYSWINQLFNLSYYLGDEVYDGDEFIGNYYYYWAQYHLTNTGWEFNSTTLGFITTVEESYIGLIFWASPPTMAPPENAPDFPL